MRRQVPVVVLALPLVALVVAGCARVGGEAFQPTHNGVVPLEGDATAGQTFRSATGAVRGVDLLVATFGEAADADGTLTVTLTEAATGEELARAEVAGGELADNAWVAVRFGAPVPVADAAAVEAGWDGTRPIALRANVPPAEPAELGQGEGERGDSSEGADQTAPLLNDPYPGGELLRDGAPATGDLAFRVVGDPGPGDVIATAGGLARGLAAGLAAQPLFGVAWVLLLGGALLLALRGLHGRRPPRRRGTVAQLRQRRRDQQDGQRDEGRP